MRIKLMCRCGASGEWDGSSYILPGGRKDNSSHIFQVEFLADKWLEDHREICPIARGEIVDGSVVFESMDEIQGRETQN